MAAVCIQELDAVRNQNANEFTEITCMQRMRRPFSMRFIVLDPNWSNLSSHETLGVSNYFPRESNVLQPLHLTFGQCNPSQLALVVTVVRSSGSNSSPCLSMTVFLYRSVRLVSNGNRCNFPLFVCDVRPVWRRGRQRAVSFFEYQARVFVRTLHRGRRDSLLLLSYAAPFL